MLRELSIRELTDIEMDMVSGGTEGEDVVVATGTRRSDWNGYIPPNPYGGNSSNYHESYQPTNTGGGGGSTPPPAPESDPLPTCGETPDWWPGVNVSGISGSFFGITFDVPLFDFTLWGETDTLREALDLCERG